MGQIMPGGLNTRRKSIFKVKPVDISQEDLPLVL